MFMQSLKFVFICIFVLTTFCLHAQEGRVLMTKEVSMEARYFGNRYYISGEKVSWRAFGAELSRTPKAKEAFEYGRDLQIASLVLGLPASIILGWHLDALFERGSDKTYLVAGLIGVLGSYGLEYKSNVVLKKSIDLHNNSPAVGARLLVRPGSIVLQF